MSYIRIYNNLGMLNVCSYMPNYHNKLDRLIVCSSMPDLHNKFGRLIVNKCQIHIMCHIYGMLIACSYMPD